MRAEFKLLAGCLIALSVGALVIAPLVFSLLNTTKAQTTFEPYFDAQMVYAFLRFSQNESGSSRESGVALNVTLHVNEGEELPDALISYFIVQVYSDAGPVENLTLYQGAAYNKFFAADQFNSFIVNKNTWFGNRTGGGGNFYFNSTADMSFILSNGELRSDTGGSGALPGGQMPNEIFVNVTRLGSVIFNGNTTVISQTNAGFIDHVLLEKYKDGFLYNTIIPEDQVDQINELIPNRYNAP
jgi:hypothetical protein